MGNDRDPITVVPVLLECGHRSAIYHWGINTIVGTTIVCGQCPRRQIAGMDSLGIAKIVKDLREESSIQT